MFIFFKLRSTEPEAHTGYNDVTRYYGAFMRRRSSCGYISSEYY